MAQDIINPRKQSDWDRNKERIVPKKELPTETFHKKGKKQRYVRHNHR